MRMRALILGILATTLAHPALACTVVSKPDPEHLVAGADLIIRAQALDCKPAPENGEAEDLRDENDCGRKITFRVVEVLKGTFLKSEFVLAGILTDEDEFNDGPVPYAHVRRSGSAGCWTSRYKREAEYLLFFKEREGGYSLRWSPLAPVNEQLRGRYDPWLYWVKGLLDRTSYSEGAEDV